MSILWLLLLQLLVDLLVLGVLSGLLLLIRLPALFLPDTTEYHVAFFIVLTILVLELALALVPDLIYVWQFMQNKMQ